MQSVDNKDALITDKKQLTEIFFSGCKTDEKIGVESEKLLVYKDDFTAVKYEDVVRILERFDLNLYERVYENGNLIGLKSDFATVSLEPGSQTEISLFPSDNLNYITSKLTGFYTALANYAEEIGATVLNSGIQPISSYENINIIPKKRYEYMTKYLPTKGSEPFIMMRETAGIQANFDYKSERDAIKKLALALKMSGIVASIYANSPVRRGKNTGYKSYRTASWLRVDEERCGLIDKKLFDKDPDFSFEDYANVLANVPVIFINRGNEYFEQRMTFREYMIKGFNGIRATVSDWETHISLYFPDVRLKSYVEIRNHDAQNAALTFSVPAFWKGIMYNSSAAEAIEEILEKYSYEDFMQLRAEIPVKAIKAKLGNIEISQYVKEFFDISYQSLKQNGKDEEKYLEPVYEYINSKRVPADDIANEYQNRRYKNF